MRDPYRLRRRQGIGMWRRLQLYLLGIVVLLIAGAVLGNWLLGLIFSVKFILFVVAVVAVLLIVGWINISRRARRRW